MGRRVGSDVEDRQYDPFAPVRGKCVYWREQLTEEDLWDLRIKPEDRGVRCSCFVEGYIWSTTVGSVEIDCPRADHCRYYITSG